MDSTPIAATIALMTQNRHSEITAAIDALRRGQPVTLASYGTLYPAEFLHEAALGDMPKERRMILAAPRAKMLGYKGEAAVVTTDISGLRCAEIRALANPLERPTPNTSVGFTDACAEEAGALTLAKHASLIPALIATSPQSEALTCSAEQLHAYLQDTDINVQETARAKLPMASSENATIVSYRTDSGASEHLAVIIGKPEKQRTPLVRVHSSCTTGDLLQSLRCDCGNQLHGALRQMAEAGHGVLIYLHQEGRGIGITNKIRAYALQQEGMDTYEANQALGYEDDERDFTLAASILRALGISSINLLTNNPSKIRNLEAHGIHVALRTPLIEGQGEHNHAYLEAKAKKSGHLL